MSEYWKSTPKYWCKHCKAFVKDTKLEKINHDATPRHQGNIKRFLRDLHRGQEREERDKQRAKNEVQRLNGVVSGVNASDAVLDAGAPWRRRPVTGLSANTLRQATPVERKQQLAQLAEMGVAIPEDFRKEMAMAGDWQMLSETPISEIKTRKEEVEDRKPDAFNVGIRKRKYEGQEEEEEAGEMVVRRGWGSITRTYPGLYEDGEDLDSLFTKSKLLLRQASTDHGATINKGTFQNQTDPLEEHAMEENAQFALEGSSIKKEEPDGAIVPLQTVSINDHLDHAAVKIESDPGEPEITFKKRKTKPIRQK